MNKVPYSWMLMTDEEKMSFIESEDHKQNDYYDNDTEIDDIIIEEKNYEFFDEDEIEGDEL
jgi:hypothetical protein